MAQFGIGQAVRRVEDRRFLTGRGKYVEDISLPRQGFMGVLLSPHAHARLVSIDASKAAALDRVLCVLTGVDVAADTLGGFTAAAMPEDLGAPPGHRTFRPILVPDRARCVGDRVALVVAETPALARPRRTRPGDRPGTGRALHL
jgi:aerobic carbon-monoxide dehydrogenase large subunit